LLAKAKREARRGSGQTCGVAVSDGCAVAVLLLGYCSPPSPHTHPGRCASCRRRWWTDPESRQRLRGCALACGGILIGAQRVKPARAGACCNRDGVVVDVATAMNAAPLAGIGRRVAVAPFEAAGRQVRSGVPRVSLHALRHSHATHLLKSGVNPKVTSERLGHTSVAITLDIYSHVLPSMQEDAARTIDALMRTALEQKKIDP
jgi:hypothetical protein